MKTTVPLAYPAGLAAQHVRLRPGSAGVYVKWPGPDPWVGLGPCSTLLYLLVAVFAAEWHTIRCETRFSFMDPLGTTMITQLQWACLGIAEWFQFQRHAYPRKTEIFVVAPL